MEGRDKTHVLFEYHNGEMVAYYLNDENDLQPFRERKVPPELAREIHRFLEQDAPEFEFEPHEKAPDCMFVGRRRT